MSWIKKMQDKWELKSLWQVIIVLIVFSLTGFTVLYIKGPIVDFIRGDNEKEWWMTVLYILLILPIYNIILLIYGFIFGQFAFFWKYEQKMLKRFGYKKNASEK
jgi:H+/Cl- antiporter ClcA